MKFVDSCILKLQAGKGGDGALAWRREAHYSHGGPFGGNGGNGGNIIFVGDHNINTLFSLRNLKILNAQNGINGASKVQNGANGENKIIKVPCGTIVTDLITNKKLFDIVYHNQTQLVCQGGKGGRGNFSFKSAINQAPSLYERGDLGETLQVKLEIQSIADVGLLGLPNAGKSTFLRQISNAKPKVAPYPFTTLEPVLGIVELEEKKLVFADIPGLIENASQGAGLGQDFLKHLNRCHVLIHLIAYDSSYGIIESLKIIEKEIQQYNNDLFQKPRIIVINKSDLSTDQKALNQVIEDLIQASKKNVFVISSLNQSGIKDLLKVVFETTEKAKEKLELENVLEINNQKIILNDEISLTIQKENYQWNILGTNVAYWVWKIPQNTIDNRLRLRQKFQTMDLDQKLIDAGAKKGDTVHAYGLTWTFLTNNDYE